LVLRYGADHQWIRIERGEATVGLSDFAQEELGEIAYVELPEEGRVVRQGEAVGAVDSMKSTSELYAPLSGTVIRVNGALRDGKACERINRDPLGEGWLYILAISTPSQLDGLLTPEGYRRLLEGTDGAS
jgi:glycine cleavage system H protein